MIHINRASKDAWSPMHWSPQQPDAAFVLVWRVSHCPAGQYIAYLPGAPSGPLPSCAEPIGGCPGAGGVPRVPVGVGPICMPLWLRLPAATVGPCSASRERFSIRGGPGGGVFSVATEDFGSILVPLSADAFATTSSEAATIDSNVLVFDILYSDKRKSLVYNNPRTGLLDGGSA